MSEVERKCKTCAVIKPIDAFAVDPRYRGGRVPRCTPCVTARRATLYVREREPVGAVKRCRKCEEEKDLAAFTKDRRSPDGYSPRCAGCRREARPGTESSATARDRMLRWKFGITSADYDTMHAAQDGRCAACGGEQGSPGRAYLDIDHCHETGQVRGLLCGPCNRALGMLEDSPRRIAGLHRYIVETDARTGAGEAERDELLALARQIISRYGQGDPA